MQLSVVIPTHNPSPERLRRTVAALRRQSLPSAGWELVLVDNASDDPTRITSLDLGWHPAARLVREETLGLTPARCRGLRESTGEIVVFVDDDNLLHPDYLVAAMERFRSSPSLGAAGGRSVPEFEATPEPSLHEFFSLLALRDLGPHPLVARGLRAERQPRNRYPDCAPIGAGMAVRRTALTNWVPDDALPDRQGGRLSSAGDNDIVFSVLRGGWEVGYFPQLLLTHLIPASRLDPRYLARLNRGIQQSWMQVLLRHDACPWPPLSRTGALVRKARAWFTYRGWRYPVGYIRWQGACGHFQGRCAPKRARAVPHPARAPTPAPPLR